MIEIVFGWAESIVGKGKIAVYHHVLLFSQCGEPL